MADMLAHEIKNPLAGIRGAAQLLAEGLGPEDRELADLIVAESRRIEPVGLHRPPLPGDGVLRGEPRLPRWLRAQLLHHRLGRGLRGRRPGAQRQS